MTFSLTWLPTVLRNAGLKVALDPGWENRGARSRDVSDIRGLICHHTAGPSNGNMPSLGVIREGTSSISGPLSQLGLGRDGTYFVVAAGRTHHAGRGNWRDLRNGEGNSHLIGIEAENTGSSSDLPWPEVQMDAYRRGVAAILSHLGLDASTCIAHKEWAPGRKIDPTFDMNVFRLQVTEIMNGTGLVRPQIPSTDPTGRPTLRRGATGDLVREIQAKIGVTADGDFGPRTEAAVREFQRQRGLTPDGIVGPLTWAALDGVSDGGGAGGGIAQPVLRRGATGEAVRILQSKLGITVDGQFGPMTESAVIGFQRARGLAADGIVGPNTWAELDR